MNEILNVEKIKSATVDELVKICEQNGESAFQHLLNADSVLNLDVDTKNLLIALYRGEDPKVIASKLVKFDKNGEYSQISHNAVKLRKMKFHEELIKSKVYYLLLNLLFKKQPLRKYNKKLQPEQPEQIPYFSSPESEMAGVADKLDVHSAPLLHATTITAMAKKTLNGDLSFLVCDKKAFCADSYSTDGKSSPNLYDTPNGEHLEVKDIVRSDNRLCDGSFKNCAVRGLKEEIYFRKADLHHDKLQILTRLDYYSENSDTGRYNNEITYCYFYPLEEQTDVRVKEKNYDSLQQLIVREMPIRYFSYTELLALPKENLCDGLGRVIEYFTENPEVHEKLKKMFD